jgi:hypothetical protein
VFAVTWITKRLTFKNHHVKIYGSNFALYYFERIKRYMKYLTNTLKKISNILTSSSVFAVKFAKYQAMHPTNNSPPLCVCSYIRNNTFAWKSLRLLARRSPHFFAQQQNLPVTAGAGNRTMQKYLHSMLTKMNKEKCQVSRADKKGEGGSIE